METFRALWISFFGFTVAGVALADPLFESQDTLVIQLAAPLRDMARDRSADPDYRPGQLTLQGPADVDAQPGAQPVRTFDLKVRPRGNSRRDREVCAFPPLRLNFRKQDVAGTVFDGQDKLKLVSYCRRGDRYVQYVYKEYLAYRLLNQVTDASFRVRPLDVEYVDSERGGKPERYFGFLIESDDGLARRLGLEELEAERISYTRLDPAHASIVELFQFMIGNTDFSFLRGPEGDDCCHNAVLLQAQDGGVLPIPYDFDISGFVDPPYAVVDGQLPIKNVRDRHYRGICREGDVHVEAVRRFQTSRTAIMTTLQTETGLDARARENAVAYLEGFFDVLDDPSELEDEVLSACRG